MTLSAEVVRLLSRGDDGALEFSDAAIPRLVALVSGHDGEAAVDDARALARVAQFLDEEKAAPRAAATLMTLVVAISDRVQRAAVARADAVMADAPVDQATLTSFRGDARVRSALDSGTRPAGTIPAGPAARFASHKKH